MTHILIVNSPYYAQITEELILGAVGELTEQNATYDEVSVPGALEIAPAIRYALHNKVYDGFIALGCVVRGETSHYATVCQESSRGLTMLSIDYKAAIGNGILTVESTEQAWVRADITNGNKGRDAARACLRLIELKRQFDVPA